jgi:hypothetical protein
MDGFGGFSHGERVDGAGIGGMLNFDLRADFEVGPYVRSRTLDRFGLARHPAGGRLRSASRSSRTTSSSVVAEKSV